MVCGTSGKKCAVVLLNLGGPGSLHEVEGFLFSLFSDQRIIGLPNPFRMFLAALIAKLRKKSAQKIYALMGGKSTILEETELQASTLEKRLNCTTKDTTYRVFVCMRHSKPCSMEVLQDVHNYQPEHIVLLPMYPQYSSTTTLSAIEDWYRNARKMRYKCNTSVVCCYHTHPDYIASHCKLILSEYKKALLIHGSPRVLFSAHGLPTRIVKRGDPYQNHVQQSVDAIVESMGIQSLDYSICYQSKVGPVKWLEPSTRSEILRAKSHGIPVVVVPISFVSEHSETLVELDIEYKALMPEEGQYLRVPALGIDESFIECLRNLSCIKHETSSPCNGKLCWKRLRSATTQGKRHYK
ncbi:ferrochelatase [Anaplasma capra]|uniref:ferrochelatase n=1 Tax=Anaplasma capra TaxID=1562740 RepID=UPI0021D580AD|nr:ferrochelatase [Anaplasma capra]MCU7611899.1 ferrochelatase [Anaplasma capra]